MVKKTAKKAAPARKKAVAKKTAPARKKAVAKKAAPAPKKAVAKKAAPVRKKAVAKKAVAKKAAPVRKKAVAKKAVAKKAAPVRKKAVAKKAAPVRKKAVAKKAVAKKAAPVRKKAVAKKAVVAKKATSTKTIVFTKNVPDEFSTTTKAPWSDAETELPAFLQSPGVDAKREIVQTQAYVKKKSKPFLLWPVVGLSTVAIISFMAFSIGTSDTKLSDKSDSVIVDERAASTATASPVPSPSEASDPKQSPAPKPDVEKATSDSDSLAPKLFAGVAIGEEITFGWKSPISTTRIVGFELLTRPVGSQSWVPISSVTVEQMSITVELDSMLSTSEYRIASVLDNGKLIYNPLTLSFVGVVG